MLVYLTSLLMYISFLIIVSLCAFFYGKIIYKQAQRKMSQNYEAVYAIENLRHLTHEIKKEYSDNPKIKLDSSFNYFKDVLDLYEQLGEYNYKELLNSIHIQEVSMENIEDIEYFYNNRKKDTILYLMELKEQFILNVICFNLNIEFSKFFDGSKTLNPEVVILKALDKEIKRLKRQDKIYTAIITKVINPLRLFVDNTLKKIKLFDKVFVFFHQSMKIVDYSKQINIESIDELIVGGKNNDLVQPFDIVVNKA